MSLLLEGKKALVTGGSRGLGKAICEIFAREGAEVAFNYSSNEIEAEKTANVVKKYGQRALTYMVSVTDRLGIRKMVNHVIEEFGRIDILVNNAAVNRADNFITMTEKS